jgi:membrane protease YdiL (CAAX protease family)
MMRTSEGPEKPGPSRFVDRHALVAFFVLACGISWLPSLFEAHSILPLGPLFAALIVLGVTGGRRSTREFLRRIVQWRVGLHWYLLVLTLPAAIALLGAWLNVAWGAGSPEWDRVPAVADLPTEFLAVFILIGVGEEPAWRGYALPRLIASRPVLLGCLLLGVMHAAWHLPLFGLEFDIHNGPPWFVGLLGFTIFTTWLYHRTHGNLLLPALLHASVNITAHYVFNPLFDGAEALRLWWLWAALWSLVALALIIIEGPGLARHLFRSTTLTPSRTLSEGNTITVTPSSSPSVT